MLFVWFCVLVFSLLIEATSAQLVSIWFVPAALIALVMSGLGAPIWLQIVSFFVVSILLLILTRPLVKRFINDEKSFFAEKKSEHNTGVGEVIEDITETSGRVLLKGIYWSAKSIDASVIPVGTKVDVVSQDGTTLIVKNHIEEEET